ncbi:MAG TPA: SOS response-associated peptidase [Gammaproteobacteria bacterium]|nr:SOS response-associated peptidase [Gammaproteobacteria bacterium]
MCGRFAMFTPLADIVSQFGVNDPPALDPRYNIAPTQPVAAIRADSEGLRSLDLLRWGLVPHWAKDPSIGNRLINARAETVAEKPAFRQAFSRRRCLVLASGFYEWSETPAGKFPFFISPRGGECLALAGLWEQWRDGEDGVLESCVIITTAANASLDRVHQRMPVLLGDEGQALWLTATTPADECLNLLKPAPEDRLEIRQVRRIVNNPSNEGAELIEAVEDEGG